MSDAQSFGAVCAAWWAELTNPEIGRSRAERAQLRRATTVAEVLTNAATHRLHRALLRAGHDLRSQPEKLALIVMTLAQVKDSGPRLALLLGHGDPKVYSTLRFDQLIRLQDPMDLARHLRRALTQVKHVAHVPALAEDLRWWNDATRARWCFEYYGAAEAAPDLNTSEKTIEETGA